jgi:uncharacterized protein YbjT (DUF2867 family)
MEVNYEGVYIQASGFLGRAVSAELAGKGHKVTGLVNTDNDGKSLKNGVQLYCGRRP